MATEVLLESRKYVILPIDEYNLLKSFTPSIDDDNDLDIEEAKQYSIDLINQWAEESSLKEK